MAGTPRKRGRDDDSESPRSAGKSSLKRSTGSPSARYLAELTLQNEHYNQELRQRLEEEERSAGKTQREALRAAAIAHERVRNQAILEQQRERLAAEEYQKRLEEEERRLLDAERQKQIEREIEEERRRAEEQRRLAELQAQADRERQEHEAEARTREQQRLEQQRREEERVKQEGQRRADEEAKKRVAEQEAEQQKARPAQVATAAAASSSEPTATTTTPDREAEHQKYLDLHQRLKQLRTDVKEALKANKPVKAQVGDWRRDVLSWVGKASKDKGGTARSRQTIITALTAARAVPQPAVDIRPFIVAREPPALPEAEYMVPGVFLYLVNILTKRLITQWINEAGTDLTNANHVGVLAISLFANDAAQWRGIPLLDMLLAKFHRACPVLFGISGDERTDAGKRRLGWHFDKTAQRFVSEQRHGERVSGLGAGFSALALRHFPPGSRLVNPYPPTHWWTALARIVNTPAPAITATHLMVLKAMIEAQPERIVDIFKSAGVVALRTALLVFVQRAPPSPAKTGLQTLPDRLRRDFPRFGL